MVVTAERLFARMDVPDLPAQGGYHHLGFPCMGTNNRILFREPNATRAAAFRTHVLRWLANFEATYSVFLEDSLVSRINREAADDWVPVGAETRALLDLCDQLYWKTRGLVDPTLGPLIALWDFRNPRAVPPSEQEIATARASVGWPQVLRRPDAVRFARPGMRLDFGGVGKEYAVDAVVDLAGMHGITDILVDLGHDIRVAGRAPGGGTWRLGLEHPHYPGQCWGGVSLDHGALCGSGTYLRYFEHGGHRYGHILDPRTGVPSETECQASWVIAPTAAEAGALATAAILLGYPESLRRIDEVPRAAGCVLHHETLHQTERFTFHALEDSSIRP